jgi:hypothetical protein
MNRYVPPHSKKNAKPQIITSVNSESITEFPSLGSFHSSHHEKPVMNFKLMLDESARKKEEARLKFLEYQKGSNETLAKLGWTVLLIREPRVMAERLYCREHNMPYPDDDTYVPTGPINRDHEEYEEESIVSEMSSLDDSTIWVAEDAQN